MYDKTDNIALKKLVISEFWKLNTLNFYINRKLDYEENGRVQTLKEAIEVDNAYLKLIKDNDIEYSIIEPGDIDTVIKKTLSKINEFENLPQ